MVNPLSREINFKSILLFTLPTICMMMFLSLYTIVDGVFVSAFVSTDALSSLNLVYPVINIIMGVVFMITTGSCAVVAKKMGEGKTLEAKQNFTFVYIVSFVITIVFAILVNVFMDPILSFLGTNDTLYKDARTYLSIMAYSSPMFTLQILCNFFIVTAGKPGIGLCTTICAGITNMIFDYIFIVTFDLGIAGAALATSLGYCIPGLIGLFYFIFNKKGTLHFVEFKVDFKMLKDACINGSSEMVTNLASAVTIFLFNIKMLELVGSDGVASITILLYAQFLFIAIFLGFSSGISPIYGYNYGEGNVKNLKKLFKLSYKLVVITSIVVFVGSVMILPFINQLFAGSNQNVLELANSGTMIFSLGFLTMGINIFTSSMFTALSNGKVSAILSFLRTFLFISISILFLPNYFGITGIFAAIPIAELMSLIFTLYFIYTKNKQYNYY